MKVTNYKGYEVTVFEGYNGDEVFVEKDGEKVYSARTNKGEGFQRAVRIIG